MIITGDNNDNILNGTTDADEIEGYGGNDTLTGGGGDDVFVFSPADTGSDTIVDFSAGDKIDVSALHISSFADLSLILSEAYGLSDPETDTVVDLGAGLALGFDSKVVLLNYSATALTADNFIFYTSSSAVTTTGPGTLFGGSGDDVLTGTSPYGNFLIGGGGDDRLVEGPGNNVLVGGAGRDIFVLTTGVHSDTIKDLSPAEDSINLTAYGTFDYSALAPLIYSYAGANLISLWHHSINLVGVDASAISADMFIINKATAPIVATTSQSVLLGSDGADDLALTEGGLLSGGDGDDRLTTSGTRDSSKLFGGLGRDTFVIETNSLVAIMDFAGDEVVDISALGIGDWNTLNALVHTYAPQYVGIFAANISLYIKLSDTTPLSAANFIFDMSTTDRQVTGIHDLQDVLVGGNGNDVLDGGYQLRSADIGDTLLGGKGNDTYYADGTDKIIEFADGGIDTVYSLTKFTLADNVENLTLLGTANNAGVGNSLYNIIVGNTGSNKLFGGDGNDVLLGGLGNDVLIGGKGNDVMSGGQGDDQYYVQMGDLISEDSDAGNDVVYSSSSWTLGSNFEDLILTGSANRFGAGNSDDNHITGNIGNNTLHGLDGNDVILGNAGNDRLDGGAGNDLMRGGLGDDTYVVDATRDVITEYAGEGNDTVEAHISYRLGSNVENLVLTGTGDINGTGNGLVNILTGNGGNNILDGGKGPDTMRGGAGNDTYVVDKPGDVVIELAAGGTDLVLSSVTSTLGSFVENLTLTGTAGLTGSGNALDNQITGNSGANILLGLDGNDTLNGMGGADIMRGGMGDDTYIVDNTADKVIEFGGQGTDTVTSSVTFTLANNVENLILSGTAATNGTGNAWANVLTGNGGNNILTGGAGADTFVFGLSSGADIITDFSASQNDKIDLSAYHAQSTAVILEIGSDTTIDLGGGNIITLTGVAATDSAFLSHITW